MKSPRIPGLLAALTLSAIANTIGCGDETMAPDPPPDTSADKPLTGEREQWTWAPVDGAFCADGSPTGLAVNLTDRSPNAVIFLMGGGACWDYDSCYESATASYIASGFGESDMPFLSIATSVVGLLNRDDPNNPFRDYSIVSAPYCTGDAFTGSRTAVYQGRQTMHVGHANVMAYLKRLVPTFPNAERIVFVGASAGGFGVAFNWWHAQQAFGKIRVDMIDDSGPFLSAPYLKPELEKTWRDAWGLDAGLPPDCAECKTTLSAITTWSPAQMPGNRGALLSFTADNVLPGFLSISEPEFTAGLDALAKQRLDAIPNARYFFAEDSAHSTLPHPDLTQNGVRLWDWIPAMLRDDPAWASVHP